MKVCTKCRVVKPLDAFTKNRKAKDGLQYRCRPCHALWYQANKQRCRDNYRAWASQNRDKTRGYARKHAQKNRVKGIDRHYRRRYGIDSADRARRIAEQDGLCPICLKVLTPDARHQTHIDHDHTTGKVRGILCGFCNRGIGSFWDDAEIVARAAEYLKKHAD